MTLEATLQKPTYLYLKSGPELLTQQERSDLAQKTSISGLSA